MDERNGLILNILTDGPASGASLARRLGLSRTAVWKRILKLRSQGYVIEGRQAAGYTLVARPDRPTPLEMGPLLPPHLRGWPIHYFEKLDSTNLKASQLAREGAPEGTCVIAESQDSGRGRFNREWFSPPGKNIYLSIIFRPNVPPLRIQGLTLVAAVAVAEAIESRTALVPQIKWPNDLLIDGKKIAGILTEMTADQDRIHSVVLGVGLNVNIEGGEFPPELSELATSLSEKKGERCSRVALVAALLIRLEIRYRTFLEDGLAPVLPHWNRRSFVSNRTVRVVDGGTIITGKVIGLDEDGALKLSNSKGETIRVIAGDVEVCR